MAKKKVVSKTRRANGEGSIFQRKSDGKWVGSLTIGYDDKGQQKRKYVYGNSQTEVAKKLAEISGRIKSNSYELVETKNFGELMADWLLVFKKSSVTGRTFEGIMRNYRLHIEPQIGNMKIYDIDTFVLQKVINNLIDQQYSVNTVKKNKHLISQFFEYTIDNKWVSVNPTLKVQVRTKDKAQSKKEKYKALPPEVRTKFLEALNKDEANFIKPLCICLMFSGLRIGEALALKWENVDFENKTLKVEQAITQEPKFDSDGNVKSRVTIVGDTKTTCSIREIPIADIVVETLKQWREKQILRHNTNKEVTGDLISRTSFIFANDDGSVRTYSGTKKIFERFKRRNDLIKYHIGFHGLRHTFSNMLFEMNENPKVIQQLLGHRDVKTTITVYNSVDSEYVRQTTQKFNEKLKEDNLFVEHPQEQQIDEQAPQQDEITLDEEILELQRLIEEKERKLKKKKERDFEM
ncbi:MAG: tyrosine-type recombinase/integrase [Candidatus Caccovivens sp.]